MNIQEEADKLRQEAKDLLNNMFCGALKIQPSHSDTVSITLSGVDRVVDCIISAAILEVTIMQNKVEFERVDFTEPIGE